MKRFNQYIEDIETGKILSCEYVKLAVKRHLKDIDRQNTKNFPYYFDEKEASFIINYAEKCIHWKGEFAGQPIKLEPHQVFYLGCLFGWKLSDGIRRFRSSYKEVARKNGKTTECAIKALYHTTADGEPGSQTYFAATKEDQARIGFRDVQEIVKATPFLNRRLKVYTKSVVYKNSFIKPLGADSKTSDGTDPSYVVIDEYHAHPTDGMLNVLESGMAARRQAMVDVITTAGYNKTNPCYSSLRENAIKILRGIKTDETFFILIYTLDKDDDWQDEGVWIKANPNLGVSVKLDFLRDRFVKAKNQGGDKEVDFKIKNLNVWTDTSSTWIPDDKWMLNKFPYPNLKGAACWAGLDLASTKDFNAFICLFPLEGIYHIRALFWIPEGKVEKNFDRVDYRGWVNDGYIKIQQGEEVVDHSKVVSDILEFTKDYDLKTIMYDRNISYANLIQDIRTNDIPLTPYPQTIVYMSEPTKELERLIYQVKLNHGGNPVLRWMCSNVFIITDSNGNIKIGKNKSREKVDGMVALVMALAGHMMKEEEGGSVYDERGIISVDENGELID